MGARLETNMYLRTVRVVWISWSLIWAAFWAVVAALSVHRYLCGAVLVYTTKGQQCVAATPTGNLGLTIISSILAVTSLALGFIPVVLGKIRRHLAARRTADVG